MKTHSVFAAILLVGVIAGLSVTTAQAARRITPPTTVGDGTKLVVSPL